MATYATVTQLRDYADLTGGVDADLEKVLARAELDVDSYCGAWPVLISGLKFNPASMNSAAAAALQRATCAQAEYRIDMGEQFFVRDQHQSVAGPDFTTTGKLGRIGPKTRQELAGSGLVVRSARVA